MDKKINNFEEASQQLQWIKTAYHIWVEDQSFLTQLKLALDDECDYLTRLLKSHEIKTSKDTDNHLLAVNKDPSGEVCQTSLSYTKIQELTGVMKEPILEDLEERKN